MQFIVNNIYTRFPGIQKINKADELGLIEEMASFFFRLLQVVPTEVLGVMKASGVINLGMATLAASDMDRKSVGAGSDWIFLRSLSEPLLESLSELWSVKWSEDPAGGRVVEAGIRLVPREQYDSYWVVLHSPSTSRWEP